MTDKIKVLILDDHAVVRAGLKHILGEAYDIEVVAEVDCVAAAWAALAQHTVDVIVTDLTLREESGMDLLKRVKAKALPVRILALSAFGEDQYAVQALKAGADGYLNKDSAPDSLIAAIRRVASGKKYISPNLAEKLADNLTGAQPQLHETLSDREFQVLRMIAAGKSLVAIAEELHVSTKTVTSYRARVLEKMAFTTNADLIRYALENGLIT